MKPNDLHTKDQDLIRTEVDNRVEYRLSDGQLWAMDFASADDYMELRKSAGDPFHIPHCPKCGALLREQK